jgi:hypothetical protein
MQPPASFLNSVWEQALSSEPFALAGVPPADEASYVLVEEALRNAIRELEWIETVSSVKLDLSAANATAARFLEKLHTSIHTYSSPEQLAKHEKLRGEIQEIFVSEQRQRALIEQHLKLRESQIRSDKP